MLVAVEVESFGVDPGTGAPLVVLKETGGNRKLAVAIGPIEASAIAMKSLNVDTEKPLTIDLVKIAVEQLGGRIDKVVFYELTENAFRTHVQVVAGLSVHLIECRPADALALGLRSGVPQYVEDAIFEKLAPAGTTKKDKLKKHISNIDTLEFGRYHLE